MKLLVLLFFCSCLGLNTRAQPHPCVSPPWITGGISMSSKDGTEASSGIYTYDGWGQQVCFRNFETEHNSTNFIDLMNFKQKVVYEIDHANQTCKKKTLETSFHPMQVPPDSLFFGQAIMETISIPAVSPPFMTGNAYIRTDVRASKTSGTFHYDALGQQIHIRSSGINPSGTFSTDLLIQFQQGRTWLDILKVVYKIDLSERKCQKMVLDVSFNPIQIPPGSVPVTQAILGTGSVDGMGRLANMCFYNILLGVRDPMDFIPPHFCQKEELKTMEDLPKTNFYRLLS